jgi:flavin-dependent dehydrogenase
MKNSGRKIIYTTDIGGVFMDVAIMGAGLSGLSCAITLEKNGIEPFIFEKRRTVGDRFVNAESLISILNRPIKDSIRYLKDNYDIVLKPVDEIKKAFFHSKHNIGCIDSPVGYINIRGRHENSYECQLSRQVKSKINFNSKYTYDELCKEFEYVILAPGDGAYASQMGNFRCDLSCTLKGVTVEGEFITDIIHLWFN